MNIIKIALKKNEADALKACISVKDNRENLEGVHLGKNFIESTNGRILLRVKHNHEHEQGSYKVIATTKVSKITYLTLEKTDGEYPNTDQIIPELKKSWLRLDVSQNSVSYSSAVIQVFQYTNNGISFEYLKTLAKLESVWEVHEYGKGISTRFNSYDGVYTAVIMPFLITKLNTHVEVQKQVA